MGFEAIADYFRRKPQGQREPWDEKIVIDGISTNATNIALPRRMREIVAQYPNVGVGSDNEDDSSNIFPAIRPPSENFTRQNPDVTTPPKSPAPIGALERRGPYVPPSDDVAPIMPPTRASDFTRGDAANVINTRRNDSGVYEPEQPSEALTIRPPVSRLDDTQLEPISQFARRAQARGTKPVLRGHTPADYARYEQELGSWDDPLDRNGRIKSGLKTALQGFARGVSSTGSLAGGIGGAATGFARGAITPNVDERMWRDEEIAKTRQTRAALDAIQIKDLQRRKLEGEIDETAARTNEIRNPRPKPEQIEVKTIRGQGTYLINKQTGERRKVDIPNEVDPEEWDTQKGEDGKYFWKNKRTQELKPMMFGGKQVKDTLVTMRLPNGQKVQVSPAVAVNAIASSGRSTQNIKNQESWRQYETQKHDIDKENQRVEKEYTEAQKAAEVYNKKHDELDKFYAALQTTEKEADKAYYQNQINNLHAQLQTLGNSLRDKYAKQGYIRYSDEERWIAGERPEPKEYPDAPELSFSEGPEVVSEEGGEGTETPAPRRSGRARRAADTAPRGDDSKVTTRSKFAETKKKYGMR